MTLFRNLKIKWKIILPSSLLIFFIVGAMLTWHLLFASQYFATQQRSNMQVIIQSMAEAVSYPLSIGDTDALQNALTHLAYIDNRIKYIVVQENNGQTVSKVGTAFPHQTMPIQDFLPRTTLSSGVRLVEIDESKVGYEMQYQVRFRNTAIGVVAIGVLPAKFFESIKKGIFVNLFLGVGAILGGIVVFAVVVQSGITAPIQELNTTAGKFCSGNLQARIGYLSKDEVGELARAFNSMASQLQQLLLEANQKNRELEKQAEERKKAQVEQHKLKTQLTQAQKMEAIGALAGGIAHDFNNILSAIHGYTQLAYQDIGQPKILRQNLDGISQSADRATNLVRQILTISRKNDQKKQPLKASLVVKEAVKLLRASIPTNIEIQQKVISDIFVQADPTRIHQIVMNLLTNAYHAMQGNGGTLTVILKEKILSDAEEISGSVLTAGRYMLLEIHDTGIGMNEEIKTKIFDPYFTTKDHEKGTGLGLAVVHDTVKSHDGAITVCSEPGQGSIFHVYLPAYDGEFDERSSSVQEETLPGGNETIMFVDDEKPIIKIAVQYLTRHGYSVYSFSNGAEALQELQRHPGKYDLVITDMGMPHMTGAELAQKALEIYPALPFILCTGHSDLIDRGTALSMGLKEYFEKPIDLTKMLQTVRQVLDNAMIYGTRVLFVDDDQCSAYLGQHVLQRLTCEVMLASSGKEALDLFSNRPEHFDLVITDQNMPNITGLELARQINTARPEIPIFLLTGAIKEDLPEKSLAKSGVMEVIPKPVEEEVLAKAISRVKQRSFPPILNPHEIDHQCAEKT